MSRLLRSLAVALIVPALPAAAATFSATLTGLQQSMPNDSGAIGHGFAVLSPDGNVLSAKLNWSGLSAPAMMAHIHCCAPLGQDAPVALEFMPSASTSGSVTGIYDLTLLGTYSAEFIKAYGSSVSVLQTTFVSGLTSGNAYFNIHDVNFPAGEIRGQISGAVPEPASWALIAVGVGVVGGAMRIRRRTPAIA